MSQAIRFLLSITLILLFNLVALSIFGQKKSVLSEAHFQDAARNLAAQYEEEEVALFAAVTTYQFEISGKGALKATEITENDYIGLKENGKETFVQFYDETSEIETVELFNYKGKDKMFPLDDRYYNNSDYFYSDARVKVGTINLSKGEKVHLRSSKVYKDIKYLTQSYFSESIPVSKKIIRFEIPDALDIELKEFNFEGFDIKKTKDVAPSSNAYVVTYELNDLEPTTKERNGPGPSHVLPHILILPKSYKTKSGKVIPLFRNTDDLYKWYYGLVQSMSNEVSPLQNKVTELTKGTKSDLAKIKNIYYWVQDNIRYIAFEDGIAGFKPDECQHVLDKGYGDCKGMSNLLKEMLILAGFDARLTWIGTKRIKYDYSTPSLAVDNHMICTLFFKDKKYFLDPTEKYNAFANYAGRIQGKQALIEDGVQYILENVPTLGCEGNLEVIERNYQIDQEEYVGTGKHTYNGEALTELLYSINNTKSDRKEEAILKFISKNDKNHLVENIEYSDVNNRDQEFDVTYNLNLKNGISSFGEEMYLDLDYYKEFDQAYLKERKFDYVFSYKYNMETQMTITIPEEMQVSELPEGFTKKNEYFNIEVEVRAEDRKIIYNKKIQLFNERLSTEHFELWNEAIEALSSFYKEQVVLKK